MGKYPLHSVVFIYLYFSSSHRGPTLRAYMRCVFTYCLEQVKDTSQCTPSQMHLFSADFKMMCSMLEVVLFFFCTEHLFHFFFFHFLYQFSCFYPSFCLCFSLCESRAHYLWLVACEDLKGAVDNATLFSCFSGK